MKIRDVTVFDIGSRVCVDGETSGQVTGIRITGKPDLVVEYEVDWWSEGAPCSAMFEAWRVLQKDEPADRIVLRLNEVEVPA